MICALRPSRRKMCAKLFITVVVPAPDDPVTATMGCLVDIRCLENSRFGAQSRSQQRFWTEHRALVEQRRAIGTVRAAGVLGVVPLDAFDFITRAQYQGDALMKYLGCALEQPLVSRRSAASGLL